MRHRIRRLVVPILLCAPVAVGASRDGAPPLQDPEIWRAAGTWLTLLDSHDYAASWREASRVFQSATSADRWARQATALGERSGQPTSRELLDSREVIDPTGVPAGSYVRLRFECRCTRADTVRETILMVDEGRRGWRVASYVAEPVAGSR